jgi:membrane protease YdiL (CAAX protease family)
MQADAVPDEIGRESAAPGLDRLFAAGGTPPHGTSAYQAPWYPPAAGGPPAAPLLPQASYRQPPTSPTAPPPRCTHRWGLGAYLIVELVFLLASSALGAMLGKQLLSSAGGLALALVVPTALAAGTAIMITMWRGNGPRVDLGLRFSWRDVGLGLAFGFGGLVITIPASIVYVAVAGAAASSAVGEEFDGVRSGPWLAALVFVIVVFVAPLCEEIVYRGLLWGALERLGAYRWWAVVISTLVFALAHFESSRTPLLLVVAIPIALARLYSGRLVAGVVAHSVNNLLPGIALTLALLGVLPGT